MSTEPLILVDGSSYFFRAYHALPPLINSRGLPTGAILGVVNMVRRLIKDYHPKNMAVIFDVAGKTFREEWYPEYKAHRPSMPEDLKQQFEPLCRLLKLMGIPVILIPGVEADDVIGTLTAEAVRNNISVLISTSDKDMAQLVGPKVKLINTMSNQLLDEAAVFVKFGVKPTQIIDYLTLVGDSSDNIPGVPQCGPKTAAKWLQEYQSLENIVANAPLISGKIGEKLRAHLANFELMKKLVTIKQDVSLSLKTHDLSCRPAQHDKLLERLEDLQFKTLIKDYQSHIERSEITEQTEPYYLLILPSTRVSEKNSLALKAELENVHIKKIGYDLKQIYMQFAKKNITLRGFQFDIMLEAYLCNPTEKIAELPSLGLHEKLYSQLNDKLRQILHQIEVPLITVLARMELHGVLIDPLCLFEQSIRLKKANKVLAEEAYQLAQKEFNLNSPKQLSTLLYEEQGLPILAKTPKGKPSTAESVLQVLALNYRLPAVILAYRSLSKLLSTYTEALPKQMDPKTHRIHTTYHQTVTSTGRLSSSNPNLQNIPIRSAEGRLIRQAFIAPKDYVLLSADYSQIELRLMAHFSADEALVNAFINGGDVHAATASEVFSTPLSEVTAEQRRKAKAINFGLIYGMSAFGLSKQLGIERKDAEYYIQRYFERYPKVPIYMEKARQNAYDFGYVETLLGRRLYIPNIYSKNKAHQKAAERIAINAPLQGTAADLIKLAMIQLDDTFQKNGLAHLIMQVHDELIFEVKKESISVAKDIVRDKMEHVISLSVPLDVSIGIGDNWDLAH
jgi:DNA polymerase-1